MRLQSVNTSLLLALREALQRAGKTWYRSVVRPSIRQLYGSIAKTILLFFYQLLGLGLRPICSGQQGLSHDRERGLVLLTIVVVLALLALLATDILTVTQLQMRVSTNLLASSQQFEVAEAGLRLAEAQLEKASIPISTAIPLHIRLCYAKHMLSYQIQQLPAPICVLPEHRLGYYYRITATAQYPGNQPTVLQAYYLRPDTLICPKSLSIALKGRSSWRQLA